MKNFEIERKFLIKMPTEQEMKNLAPYTEHHILQTYLLPHDGVTERRIRQSSFAEGPGYNLYYTEKTNVEFGTREEKESQIDMQTYLGYLMEADTTLHQISKVRRSFMYKNKLFEMDVYSFNQEYAILEVELKDIKEEIDMPPLSIICEVTDNENFRNHALAKSQMFTIPASAIPEPEWVYEIGREEAEILGSGSSKYDRFFTKSFDLAMEEMKKCGRNYMRRRKVGANGRNAQYYDFRDKTWFDI